MKSGLQRHDPLDDWESAWLITINTQSRDSKYVKAFKDAWKYIVSNMTSFIWSDVDGSRLFTVRNRPVIERGPKNKRIHIHDYLAISGRGLINLDYVKIRKYVNKALRKVDEDFKGVYFNAVLIKNYNASRIIARYLAKAPMEKF